MMHKSLYFYSTALAALLLCLAAPAAAEWLVTDDGARIETRGPWKVVGSSVVFTQTNGTLASLRAARVDLEASTSESSAGNSPAPTPTLVAAAAEPPRPVMVLTDYDVAGYYPSPVDEDPEAKQGAEEESSSSSLFVNQWDEVKDPTDYDSVEIVGTVVRHEKNGFAISYTKDDPEVRRLVEDVAAIVSA